MSAKGGNAKRYNSQYYNNYSRKNSYSAIIRFGKFSSQKFGGFHQKYFLLKF
jgi:hypothetical protein